MSVEARFWAKVKKGDGCWEWQAGRAGTGYGQFRPNQRQWISAHRMSYTLINGPIPAGMAVCHTCDNRLCVRPDHLWLGTLAENNADMRRKGRAGAARGERAPGARLSDSEVEDIRSLRSAGLTTVAIAARFGINSATVSRISRGLSRPVPA